MGAIGAAIGALIFLLIYFLVLKGGQVVVEKTVDVTTDVIGKGVSKGTKVVKEQIKPAVENKIQTIHKTILEPNAFSEVWSLIDFMSKYGVSLNVKSQVNEATKEVYRTCEIKSNRGKIYSLEFIAPLEEMSIKEIENRKKDLYVCKTNRGKYYLSDKDYMNE